MPIYASEAYLWFYQDSVDSLRKIFNRLNLIVYGEGAVRFADPEIFRILTTEKAYCDYNPDTGKIGYLVPIDRDGDGMMTQAELESIRLLSNRPDMNSSVFAENTTLQTFNEFRFFTGLPFLGGGMFKNCTSLREITLPNNITSIRSGFLSNTAIKKLVIPEGYIEISSEMIAYDTALELVDLPSTLTTLGTGINRQGSLYFRLICRATTPPTFDGAWWDNSNKGKPITIYVPDASVTTYKTASGWSKSSSLIQPLSTYSL